MSLSGLIDDVTIRFALARPCLHQRYALGMRNAKLARFQRFRLFPGLSGACSFLCGQIGCTTLQGVAWRRLRSIHVLLHLSFWLRMYGWRLGWEHGTVVSPPALALART